MNWGYKTNRKKTQLVTESTDRAERVKRLQEEQNEQECFVKTANVREREKLG